MSLQRSAITVFPSKYDSKCPPPDSTFSLFRDIAVVTSHCEHIVHVFCFLRISGDEDEQKICVSIMALI